MKRTVIRQCTKQVHKAGGREGGGEMGVERLVSSFRFRHGERASRRGVQVSAQVSSRATVAHPLPPPPLPKPPRKRHGCGVSPTSCVGPSPPPRLMRVEPPPLITVSALLDPPGTRRGSNARRAHGVAMVLFVPRKRCTSSLVFFCFVSRTVTKKVRHGAGTVYESTPTTRQQCGEYAYSSIYTYAIADKQHRTDSDEGGGVHASVCVCVRRTLYACIYKTTAPRATRQRTTAAKTTRKHR